MQFWQFQAIPGCNPPQKRKRLYQLSQNCDITAPCYWTMNFGRLNVKIASQKLSWNCFWGAVILTWGLNDFCAIISGKLIFLTVWRTCYSEMREWPPPPTYKAKLWTRIRTKYGPKCFKTRQTRQFCGHIFVHIFALYVGVGVAKWFPVISQKSKTN